MFGQLLVQLAAHIEARLLRSVGGADSASPWAYLQAVPRNSMDEMAHMERVLAQHVCAGRRLLASEASIGLATEAGGS